MLSPQTLQSAATKTAVWDLMQEMRLGMLVRRVRQLEDENASFKRQIYELKVMCIRAENRKRWSGSDSDYPWFEMPTPEGRLPSEIGLPKVTSYEVVCSLTEDEVMKLLEAWPVADREPAPHFGPERRLAGLQALIFRHTGGRIF